MFDKKDDAVQFGGRTDVVDDTSDDYVVLRDKFTGLAWVQYRGGHSSPVSCHPDVHLPRLGAYDFFGRHAKVVRSGAWYYNTSVCCVRGKYGEIARQHCQCGGEHTRFVPRYKQTGEVAVSVLSKEYSYHASTYCSACAPQGAEAEAHPSEVDSPLTCESCSRPLYCTLTNYGVRALLESIMETLDGGPASWDHVVSLPGDYYHGSRQIEVMRDIVTAAGLCDYDISDTDRWVVGYFLEATKPPSERYKKPGTASPVVGVTYERKKRKIRRPKPVEDEE